MRRSLIAIAAIIVVLAPIIYLGALGPIVWLERRGYIIAGENSCFDWLYRPVTQAAIKYPVVGRPLKWYVSLWEPPPVPNHP